MRLDKIKIILGSVENILGGFGLYKTHGDMDESKYCELKARLASMPSPIKTSLILGGIFGLLLLILVVAPANENSARIPINTRILIACLFGILVFLAAYASINLSITETRTKILSYEIENVQDQVDEDPFENSIKMSYKYLDQYYLQTRSQAQNGFYITVGIAIGGAILISIGVIALFLGKTEPSYLTCAAGVITEFIATIFFYLYNKTVVSMSRYHNKLVFSHNISIALKVAETLPEEEKIKSKELIISQLLQDINQHLTNEDRIE